jgi:hypothetical protein
MIWRQERDAPGDGFVLDPGRKFVVVREPSSVRPAQQGHGYGRGQEDSGAEMQVSFVQSNRKQAVLQHADTLHDKRRVARQKQVPAMTVVPSSNLVSFMLQAT